MNIDYIKWEFYGKVFTWISNVVLWIYVITSNRQRVTTSKIEKIERSTGKQFKDHQTRIVCLETDYKHLPNLEQLQEISAKLDKSNSELHTLMGRFEGVNRVADLMNEFLINQGGRKK